MSGPLGSSQWMYNAGGDFYPTEIDQSLMFDGTSYLSRTPSVAGNRKTWTWSSWVKRSGIAANGVLFAARTAVSGTYFVLSFQSSGDLRIESNLETAYPLYKTNALFRDPSAWYHIVLAVDMTQATSTNRVKLYVNEVLQTTVSYNVPAQNTDLNVNSTETHLIGQQASGNYLNGYLADTYFVDGTALDPTSFGEFKNGVWIPKAYTGSYGTNGFHLTYQDDTVSEGFNTVTYTGTGTTQSISGIGFSPDFVWIKARNQTYSHRLIDSVRGGTKGLNSSLTAAETTTNAISSFDADGFSIPNGATSEVNNAAGNYVAWNWDAGDSTVSNTDGSITSSVRANPAYGFSIVSYTGNGTAGATIGHGLSATPSVLIVKPRSIADNWNVYHASNTAQPETDVLYLNLTNATSDNNTIWNDTAPTASVFSIGSNGGINTNASPYIAYCFSEIAGYSKFGSYTGNGSASGPTVTLGFKPAFVMVKRTDGVGNWQILDATRSVVNPVNRNLYANLANAEVVGGNEDMNFLNDGFQPANASASFNVSGAAYIYMAFADTRDLAFWRDQSGNGNDWQPTNLNYQDTVFDSPTNNYCTLNPLDKDGHTNSEGNLKVSGNVIYGHEKSTFAVTSGKWYFEAALTVQQNDTAIGLTNQSASTLDHYLGQTTDSVGYLSDGRFFYNGSSTSYSSWTTSDVAQIAFDADTGEIWIGKNNTYQNSGDPANGTGEVVTVSWNEFIPAARTVGSGVLVFNFGQSGFTYTPPDGFLALCTANLPEPSISPANGDSPQDYFNTVLYAGDYTTSHSITGVGFSPDFTWIKDRGLTTAYSYSHVLSDTVRGAGKWISSNRTDAEIDFGTGTSSPFRSFDADGFTVGQNHQTNEVDPVADYFVAWNWKASNATAVSNTAGTITSQVSANPTAGFSIVSWTGNGIAGASVGHGLDSAPEIIITKDRDATKNWVVYNKEIGATNVLLLNNTAASSTNNAYNDTDPTATVFECDAGNPSFGTEININSNDYISYCFHSVEGYSKFGSYTGNGSPDGPFVYTGFRPAYVMVKRTDAADSWAMFDSSRDAYNAEDKLIRAEASNAEASMQSLVSNPFGDFLSNGFKVRNTSTIDNASGGTYIYMAFAENPFKYANAR